MGGSCYGWRNSETAIHPTADIFGETDTLLSMTIHRIAAEGGRTQISLRNLRKT
jgi:hypothetical protein